MPTGTTIPGTGEMLWLLDLSRLLSRADAPAPTGIDRVEMAYALYLLRERDGDGAQVAFCAFHPLGFVGGIDLALAADFVCALDARWSGTPQTQEQGRESREDVARLRRRIRAGLFRRGLPRGERIIYLLLSHHHLTRPFSIRTLLKATGALFVPMVHDVIPLDYPEYGRPREEKRHALRMRTVARFADGILVPSEAVKTALARRIPAAIPVWAVPHGAVARPSAGAQTSTIGLPTIPERPYFVYLSTIEPRKNHLMLLHVWRRLVDTNPQCAPVLVLIGKRGWENENVIDILNRSITLRPYLVEYNALPDGAVARLLRSAAALLFPSWVEGYGLPVAEALSSGVPVICSDIPVLREVGGNVADYVDPLDGAAWAQIIADYATDGPKSRAQRARMQGWEPVAWERSVALALGRIKTGLAPVSRPRDGDICLARRAEPENIFFAGCVRGKVRQKGREGQ